MPNFTYYPFYDNINSSNDFNCIVLVTQNKLRILFFSFNYNTALLFNLFCFYASSVFEALKHFLYQQVPIANVKSFCWQDKKEMMEYGVRNYMV